MLRLWSVLRSENEERISARNQPFHLRDAYRKASRVAELQGREAPKAFDSPPMHRRKRGSGGPSMRARKGDKRRRAEAKTAAETSTDGLDEASAEEVERLIAEFGLVYERKVRAKEEMVELPAEPLAAGILSDDLMEMVEPAEPRKPTLEVGCRGVCVGWRPGALSVVSCPVVTHARARDRFRPRHGSH